MIFVMKKICLVLLILSQFVCLASCDFGTYFYVQSEEKASYVVSGYNIPGIDSEGFFDSEVIAEDSYGRKLYRISYFLPGGFYGEAYDEKTGINLRAYVITQKETQKGVYYLDTVCYLMRISWDEFTDELLAEFKTLNHWETELKTDELCFKAYPKNDLGGLELDVPYSEVSEAFHFYTGKDLYEENENVFTEFVCNDHVGKCLFFVRDFSGTDIRSFAIIVVPGNTDSPHHAVELEDFYDQNQDIIALKEKANWETP